MCVCSMVQQHKVLYSSTPKLGEVRHARLLRTTQLELIHTGWLGFTKKSDGVRDLDQNGS